MPLRGASVEHGPHLFCSFRNANFLCLHRSTENWKMQGLCKKMERPPEKISLLTRGVSRVYTASILKNPVNGTERKPVRKRERRSPAESLRGAHCLSHHPGGALSKPQTAFFAAGEGATQMRRDAKKSGGRFCRKQSGTANCLIRLCTVGCGGVFC